MLPRSCHNCEQTSDKTTSTTSQVKNVMSSGMTSLAGAAVRLRVVTVTDPDTCQYKSDIFAILHPTSKPILPSNTRIHHFDTYNNQQQLSVRLRHTCVLRLISPKSVGASSLIVYCHFITDIIFRTDCDVTMRLWRNNVFVTSRCVTMRYNTLRRNQNVLQR